MKGKGGVKKKRKEERRERKQKKLAFFSFVSFLSAFSSSFRFFLPPFLHFFSFPILSSFVSSLSPPFLFRFFPFPPFSAFSTSFLSLPCSSPAFLIGHLYKISAKFLNSKEIKTSKSTPRVDSRSRLTWNRSVRLSHSVRLKNGAEPST
jgi:hypothetical protein